jgi:hypothetical protein
MAHPPEIGVSEHELDETKRSLRANILPGGFVSKKRVAGIVQQQN